MNLRLGLELETLRCGTSWTSFSRDLAVLDFLFFLDFFGLEVSSLSSNSVTSIASNACAAACAASECPASFGLVRVSVRVRARATG